MTIESSSSISILAHFRHDLRTPINAIIGYSEMLLEELAMEGNTILLTDLQGIRDRGAKLLALVNTLLGSSEGDEDWLSLDSLVFKQTIVPQLVAPAKEVTTFCERISLRIDRDFAADIQKIHVAACNFLQIIDKTSSLTVDEHIYSFSGDLDDSIRKVNDLPLESLQVSVGDRSQNLQKSNTENNGTILVVDDNPVNRDLLSRQVKAQGYRVETAANGQQVLDMIPTGNFDLILLDIIMPEMDGYQVLNALRESQWRYIPVIMISALDRIDSVVKCIEMGAEDYLTKPFNPTLLRARIGACLEKKRLRDREISYLEQLGKANQEITILNGRLQTENLRLNAELEITKRLQQMILPKERELSQIDGLDIAGFMEPTEEVGGDYYDVLQHGDRVKIAIGDVTGHGLESGVLSIMVQTAVRTLIENDETDLNRFLEVLNRTIYKNTQRMNCDKNLTFCLMDYHQNQLNLSGQHEEIVIVRANGKVDRIDTIDLGFPLGLEESVSDFIDSKKIDLNTDDLVILYTDGVTEAENDCGEQYGLERLCTVAQNNSKENARAIQKIIIEDLRCYIGNQKIYDDITLVILKKT
jgi:serine phosphatase RsbU (regulator of sigma subunit)